jgi:hypothetical protein
MILRRNQDLFNTIKALAGVNDFTDNEIADLVSFSNRRLTMAYNTSPMWERYVVVSEPRILSTFKLGDRTTDTNYNNQYYYKYGTYEHTTGQFSDFFTVVDRSLTGQASAHFAKRSDGKWFWGGATFSKNLETGVVTISGGTSFSVQQDEEERDSPLDVLVWSNVTSIGSGTLSLEAKNTVLYDESYEEDSSSDAAEQKQTIQDFIRIHRKRAFLNNSATEYDFYVDADGANVLNSTATDGEVFVTYKKPIVNTTTGQVITSLDTTATSNYLTEIPLEFFNYTAHGVYADFLRMDGQHDKAAFEEQKADMFLATELERIDIINNNNSLNHKFSTYVNTSSR